MALKKNYAKARYRYDMEPKTHFYLFQNKHEMDIEESIQDELKKKRNRLSAQISRDRKKQMLIELEKSHEILK